MIDGEINKEEPNIMKAEEQEKVVSQRKVLLESANTFFLNYDQKIPDSTDLEDKELALQIQERFQQTIKDFYQDSGLQVEIQEAIKAQGDNQAMPLDELIAGIVARRANGKEPMKGVRGISGMFPVINQQYPDNIAPLECTLSSAMLKCGLEDAGMMDARTALVSGHQLVIRQLPDGSMKYIDPSTTRTVKGNIQAFSHVFSKDEIEDLKPDSRPGDPNAFLFKIHAKEEAFDYLPHSNGGGTGNKKFVGDFLFGEDVRVGEGEWKKYVYAHDPNVYISIGTLLSNLVGIPHDDSEETKAQSEVVTEQFPFIQQINCDELERTFGIFQPNSYLRKLSEEHDRSTKLSDIREKLDSVSTPA